jgi:uncharacterized protein YjiS (DUF1127 family)
MSHADMARSTHIPRLSHGTAITTPVLPRLLAALRRMHTRWHQRHDLRELDDHLLRDIGVTREQARREASKPFWR